MSLTAAARARLLRAITAARRLIEDDFAAAAEGRFGLRRPDRIEPEESLALPPAAVGVRRQLVDIVEHLGTADDNDAGPVGNLVREATFTTLNRLVAIRVAESIGLLPPALADGRRSQGFTDLIDCFPLLRDDDTGGYGAFLRLCADELGRDAPVLFDPRNPLLVLEPSPPALDKLVSVFADPALADVWAEPDAFGWTYQFFKTAEEDNRKGVTAPRSSRELALRNQFFTPRYVVDFLVHNSLGRRLLEADPDSPLAEDLTMLVEAPDKQGAVLELDEVRILDPAVGSGHFLLGCYDVLEQAWGARDVDPADAAPRILPALWGIDIDSRCGQVAAAALALRARRCCPEGELPSPKIITARALPDDARAWHDALADLARPERELIGRIREVLRKAPTLGSLLRVEEALATEIRAVSPGADFDDSRLFASIANDAFGRAERRILAVLRTAATAANATVAERLLAAEATDAIGFIEALRQRYDAVIMNPPFGEPVPDTKGYLKGAYPWMPSRTSDLLTAFVGRGLELCTPDGYLGAITSRAGMFLTTFEQWRTEVLLGHRLTALADLGYGVMQGALVEAAAYVVGARARRPEDEAVFIRLVKEADKAGALKRVVAELRASGSSPLVQLVNLDEFERIPGSPLAHWVAPSVRSLFGSLPALEGAGAEVRLGLSTKNDPQFVRTFWEVNPAAVARSRQETKGERRWVPFAKGGEYSPFYADIHLVVDWSDDGQAIRAYVNQRYPYLNGNVDWVVKHTTYYFRAGLTWPRRTASGFGMRILPSGAIFGDKGPGVFPLDDPLVVLAWLTSRLCDSAVGVMLAAGEETTSGSPSKGYEVGLVQRLPWVGHHLDDDAKKRVAGAVTTAALARARLDEGDETSRRFVVPEVLRTQEQSIFDRACAWQATRNAMLIDAIEQTFEIERTIHHALDLDAETETYLDEEYGPHPASYPREPLDDEAALARLSAMPLDAVIDEVIARRGGSRVIATKSYFLDRRLEILAHVTGRHPAVVSEVWNKLRVLPPGEPAQSARDLVSWLVGVALGRWDVRIGRNPMVVPPQRALFDSVAVCSPGMLVAEDTLPIGVSPAGYPVELPPMPLLLDEEGHGWDIETCLRTAAAAVLDEPDAILDEVEWILGQSMRTYLRRRFFKDHLGRYSKSRRKAPIYWYLSVPSRAWGLWLYAPRLSREALYGLAQESRRRLHIASESIERIRAEEARSSGKTLVRLDTELVANERLADELRTFATEAERVAELGWVPDLNDGIILCAAPLAKLFPAWPEAEKERTKLKAGDYSWASVARWADVL